MADEPRSNEGGPPKRAAHGPSGAQGPQSSWRGAWVLLWAALALGLVLGLNQLVVRAVRPSYPIAWTTFLEVLRAGEVASLVATPGEIEGTLRTPRELPIGNPDDAHAEKKLVERFVAVRVPGGDDALAKELEEATQKHHTIVSARRDDGVGRALLGWLVVSLVVVGSLVLVMRMTGPGKQVMSFGKSRARVFAGEKETKVTFDQVAGIEEAKEELREVVEFLRDPEPYHRLGARIPRGILLVGPPGTGKTLLARAVAGEANVTFLSLSGSDFVEMFAGVGASRVRDLFEQAHRQAPCIVFIDELDALGKVRGVGVSGAHDEREQTLNQLLSEMDGFDPNKGVVMLAATNRPEVLDPALLRPGRFDRQVVVDRPDVKGRELTLRIHAKKVKLAPDVDLAKLAQQTPGLVGADLANVINEAALLAGRKRLDFVTQAELEEAIQRSLVGLERKGRVMSVTEKERIAVHETGHALMGLSVPLADPVSRVSIVARGPGALGYTMQLPVEDRHVYTRPELEDRLAVLLGGRGAERLIYEDTSTGASDDLARATDIARRMVTEFGMSDRLGPVTLGAGGRRQRYLGTAEGPAGQEYSDATAREADEEVSRIIREAEERVSEILRTRQAAVRSIATTLVKKEVILADELKALAAAAGAVPVPGRAPSLRLTAQEPT